MDNQSFTFISLKEQLPPVIPRKNIGEYLGGLLTERMMANLAWRKEGPAQVRVGRQVAYETEKLLEWLDTRVKEAEKKETKAQKKS